tara:strand:+ start:910 stop:1209 length:300 start_codon:yes stop_codon:yes gene_type:complete
MIRLTEIANKIYNKSVKFRIETVGSYHGHERKSREGFLFVKNEQIKGLLDRGMQRIISTSIKDFIRTQKIRQKYIIRDSRDPLDLVIGLKKIHQLSGLK